MLSIMAYDPIFKYPINFECQKIRMIYYISYAMASILLYLHQNIEDK